MGGIETLAHVAHVTDEIERLNEWYRKVFGVHGFMGWPEPHALESERRLASMFMVGDLCVETMAPMQPVDASTAIGRFVERRGPGLYSAAFRVADLAGLVRCLIANNVFIAGPGGTRATDVADDVRYVVPSPRDLAGARIELMNVVLTGDPRAVGPVGGPPTLRHLTCGVEDIAAATARFVGLLGAEPYEGGVSIGGCRIELVQRGMGLAGYSLAVEHLASLAGRLEDAGTRPLRERDGSLTVEVHGATLRLVEIPSR